MATTAPARIDPARLRRALALDVTPLPSGDFEVGRWHVNALWGCSCPDRQIRGVTCKHEIRVRLARLDADILNALREVLT
jgi:hypothetical protein